MGLDRSLFDETRHSNRKVESQPPVQSNRTGTFTGIAGDNNVRESEEERTAGAPALQIFSPATRNRYTTGACSEAGLHGENGPFSCLRWVSSTAETVRTMTTERMVRTGSCAPVPLGPSRRGAARTRR